MKKLTHKQQFINEVTELKQHCDKKVIETKLMLDMIAYKSISYKLCQLRTRALQLDAHEFVPSKRFKTGKYLAIKLSFDSIKSILEHETKRNISGFGYNQH